ncbi:hypothetical protein [Formosa sp. S-31]|uniref:hypothetical protein n=1 Tax=Formosa sp. S-31 TaxID=2790949 RepID=UPI003EBDF907
MKKNLVYTLLLGVFGLLLFQACQDDPEFPDPGFEITDQRVEVRRDTADFYNVHMTMKVPNKVDVIEVLDGLNYDLVETIDEYHGKTNFDFDYLVDLTGIQKDSVLNYIIKVTDQDLRSFNRGIRISVKGFSFPEIKLVGGTDVAVAAPAYVVKGTISTGLNTIESVRVVFDGEVQYSYDAIPGEELHEMDLSAQVLLGNLEEGVRYPIDIIISDNTGQESTTVVNVRKSNLVKKPYKILWKNSQDVQTEITPTFDENGNLVTFVVAFPNNGSVRQTSFEYNELNMVSVMRYRAYDSPGGTFPRENVFYFNYIPGTKQLETITEQEFGYDENGNLSSESAVSTQSSQFVYEGESTKVLSFRRSSTVSDVYYSDPFNLGEYVYGEYFQSQSYIGSNTVRRQHREDYDPVLIPTYIEGLPPHHDALTGSNLTVFQDLLYSKYIMTKTVATDPAYPGGYLTQPSYTYETDEDGNISSINKLYTDGSYQTKGDTEIFTFFYAE